MFKFNLVQYFYVFYFFIVAPEVKMSGPLKVKLDDPATFKCIVESNPVASIKWFKDDVEIESSPTLTLVDNATFTRQEETYRIQNAAASHLAVYKCEAENKVLGQSRKTEKMIDFKVECKLKSSFSCFYKNKICLLRRERRGLEFVLYLTLKTMFKR